MVSVKRGMCSVLVFMGLVGCGYYIVDSFTEKIEAVSSYIIYPMLCTQQVLVDTVDHWVKHRRDSATLHQKVHELQQECDLLRAENIKFHALEKLSGDIRELHNFRQQYEGAYTWITQIIFRHFSPQEHYFLVNAGEKAGIKREMVAIYNNCLIGKVEQVYSWYSKVRLITDRSCKVATYCTSTKTSGIYQGCNEQDKALLQYVPHFKSLILNDNVISSGEGMIFPAGFSLGRIMSCQPGGLYHTVYIKPHVDLASISYCTLMARNY